MNVTFTRVVPILRIFDLDKARQFYVDYLGFTVDWEHRSSESAPLYLQVSRGLLVLHLSEHHGDGTPGSAVYVETRDVRTFHAELRSNLPVPEPGHRGRRDRDVHDHAGSLRQHLALQRATERHVDG